MRKIGEGEASGGVRLRREGRRRRARLCGDFGLVDLARADADAVGHGLGGAERPVTAV